MKALVLVDIQRDFIDGSLAVKEAEQVVPVANRLMASDCFDVIALTQDYHPPSHKSFYTNHNDKAPFDIVDLNGAQQILWPPHCKWASHGAKFHRDLYDYLANAIFRKGMDKQVDSYSGFADNGGRPIGLGSYLKERNVIDVYIAGIALDYCVKFTTLDSVKLGFNTFLIEDGCRAVNANPDDGAKAIEEMEAAGITVINSDELTERG